jgi:hypothetical protein
MDTLIALFSSVMFVGGLVILSRTFTPRNQIIVSVVMMVVAVVLILK